MTDRREQPAPLAHVHRHASPGAFWPQVERDLEQVSFFASLVAAAAIAQSRMSSPAPPVLLPVGTLVALAVFYAALARRWQAPWLVYFADIAFTGAYFYYRSIHPLDPSIDAPVLLLFSFVQFGLSEFFERLQWQVYSRPSLYFSLVMAAVTLLVALERWQLDQVNLSIVFSTASFYGFVSYRKRWKKAGYAAALLYNAFLWIAWRRVGWELADHPQHYLIPVGLTAILFAEVNRHELGRMTAQALRSLGSMVIYVSTAVPMWQFESFGAWVTLLFLSLTGVVVGVGVRIQSFLWLGLVCFVFDVVYQLGRVGLDHAQAKWIIMLALAFLIFGFVALNEKMQIWERVRKFYMAAREWD